MRSNNSKCSSSSIRLVVLERHPLQSSSNSNTKSQSQEQFSSNKLCNGQVDSTLLGITVAVGFILALSLIHQIIAHFYWRDKDKEQVQRQQQQQQLRKEIAKYRKNSSVLLTQPIAEGRNEDALVEEAVQLLKASMSCVSRRAEEERDV